MIEIGNRFPEFHLRDQNGESWTLEDLSGRPAVIYFYPKDDTSGCTKEACEFQETLADFEGAQVFGVSPDPVESHSKFASKYGLKFPLLADPDRKLIEGAGLWVEKSMYGRNYMGVQRATALLDSNGRVLQFWPKVNPAGHAAEVLEALQRHRATVD